MSNKPTCINCGEPTAECDLLKGGICEDCYDAQKEKEAEELECPCEECNEVEATHVRPAYFPKGSDSISRGFSEWLCVECLESKYGPYDRVGFITRDQWARIKDMDERIGESAQTK